MLFHSMCESVCLNLNSVCDLCYAIIINNVFGCISFTMVASSAQRVWRNCCKWQHIIQPNIMLVPVDSKSCCHFSHIILGVSNRARPNLSHEFSLQFFALGPIQFFLFFLSPFSQRNKSFLPIDSRKPNTHNYTAYFIYLLFKWFGLFWFALCNGN